jgi:tRNA A-37 threonylcarbamoyl transferase component Bud32
MNRHQMVFHFNKLYAHYESSIKEIVFKFDSSGTMFADGKRNKIKLFDLEEKTINIKSFKIPNLLNKVIYRFFRKSKAKRSFEYATVLLEKGIGTPEPIAFVENYNWLGLLDSYFVSEHLDTELTFRELVTFPDYENHESILRQFTRFCFLLHEKGVEFLDHSPGNTLIKKEQNAVYSFYLVDLNRMKFHNAMDFNTRMKNLSHLTPKKEMIAVMSEEYAKLYGKHYDEVFSLMWKFTNEFQLKYQRKRKIKSFFKF